MAPSAPGCGINRAYSPIAGTVALLLSLIFGIDSILVNWRFGHIPGRFIDFTPETKIRHRAGKIK